MISSGILSLVVQKQPPTQSQPSIFYNNQHAEMFFVYRTYATAQHQLVAHAKAMHRVQWH